MRQGIRSVTAYQPWLAGSTLGSLTEINKRHGKSYAKHCGGGMAAGEKNI